MRWKPLSADEKNVMKPVDSMDFDGWQVDHDGDTYIISINHGHFKGRPTEVCQVSVPQRAEPVMSKISDKIKTRLVGTNNSGGAINEIYELIKHPSINPAAMLVSRSLDDRAFFTVAFMGIK
jgi:hypothetical protein